MLFSWFLVTLHLAGFITASQLRDPVTAIWSVATTLSYAAVYLLPALVLGALACWLLRRGEGAWPGRVAAIVLVTLTGVTQTMLFADRVIFGMYGFHINGFVLDLVMTPGGIASLGASRSTEVTAMLIVLAIFLLQAGAYILAMNATEARAAVVPRRLRLRWLLLLLAFLTLGERITYGVSHAMNFQPVLFASERYPLYLPMTFRKLAARLGIAGRGEEAHSAEFGRTQLSYPLVPLEVVPPAQRLNIVWLVAESLRFDMLDAKIMPELWHFSEQAVRMERHFSGGNLTQMGVFSMFYGLYGNYWFPMLAARRPPVLMDVLQQQDYQFSLHTSQRFTYPAFDKTVFAGMQAADMHASQADGAPPWQHDRENIDQILQFIDGRDPARPFMSYMFFESTHANYSFPDDEAIARPYVEDLNYLTADFARDIEAIKNRYINAAHHVDGQIARLIAHLRERGLLENTVVIVLGDHGEEFMERSRWGHSAEFNRFQTGTPAVIHVPGQSPRVIRGITSHLDIAATLMPLLGVRNPPSDYSQGGNLLAPDFHRDYAIAADWNRIAYLGEHFKITFPINATGALQNEVTDSDDWPVSDPDLVRQAIRPAMVEILGNIARFSRPVD